MQTGRSECDDAHAPFAPAQAATSNPPGQAHDEIARATGKFRSQPARSKKETVRSRAIALQRATGERLHVKPLAHDTHRASARAGVLATRRRVRTNVGVHMPTVGSEHRQAREEGLRYRIFSPGDG